MNNRLAALYSHFTCDVEHFLWSLWHIGFACINTLYFWHHVDVVSSECSNSTTLIQRSIFIFALQSWFLQSLVNFSAVQFFHVDVSYEKFYLPNSSIQITFTRKKPKNSSHGIREIAARNVRVRKFITLGCFYGTSIREMGQRNERKESHMWTKHLRGHKNAIPSRMFTSSLGSPNCLAKAFEIDLT